MSTSTKRMYNILGIVVLALFFIIVPFLRYQGSSDIPEERSFINYGLDLKGGVDLVLAVDRSQYQGEVNQEQMEGAIEVMRRKIDPGGVGEIIVQQVGEERIAVQVPGADDPDAVKDIIGRPDALKWIDVGSEPLERGTLVEFIHDVSLLDEEEEIVEAEIEPAIETDPLMDPELRDMMGSELGSSAADTGIEIVDGELVITDPELFEGMDETGAGAVEEAEPGEPGTPEGEEAVVERVQVIVDPNSDRNQVVITGDDLDWVQTTFYSNRPMISFRIGRQSAGKFAQHTGSHIGQYMAIVLNDEIISCPVIRGRIGRKGQIEGFTVDQAKELELLLNAGRIPVPLSVIQERTVSPTLGEESIQLSLRAGIVGVILILIYMLVYYRLPGLIANMALVLYGIFFMGAMSMLNATLTLPGIAGVILSLGMAVDANVIIFERLKEELGAGKTVATAVKDAFKRAWGAILDANVTTLITGFILWSVGSGPIKGFAVTLCLGIILSMFTALYITRNILESVVTSPSMQKRWLLGERGVK